LFETPVGILEMGGIDLGDQWNDAAPVSATLNVKSLPAMTVPPYGRAAIAPAVATGSP
jgi:hypothetical protein